MTMNRLEDIFFAIISFSSHRTLDCVGALVAKPGGNDNGVVWVTHSGQLSLSNPINYWLSSSVLVFFEFVNWMCNCIPAAYWLCCFSLALFFFPQVTFSNKSHQMYQRKHFDENELATKGRRKRSCM